MWITLLLLQILRNLEDLSVAKLLFHSHVLDGGGNRVHRCEGGGAINSNGYGTGHSAIMLLTERVANGYYKSVVWLSTCCHGNIIYVSL